MTRKLGLILGALLIVAGLVQGSGRVPVPGAASYTATSSLLLTASTTVSWPSDTGIQVDLYDSLSLQWRVQESTGNDPSVNVVFEESNDGTNWGIPYTANTPQPNLNGGAAWTTDDTWRIDKLTAIPGKYIRIRIAEGAADADVTFTGVFYAQ